MESSVNQSFPKTLRNWSAQLKQAYDHDSWGQVVEATDTYNSLSRTISLQLQTKQDILDTTQDALVHLSKCIVLRSNYLQNLDNEEISLKEIKQLQNVLDDIVKEKVSEIPDNLRRVASYNAGPIDGTQVQKTPSPEIQLRSFNSLKPRLQKMPNQTLVTFHIDKIALKDSLSHIDPFFLVSCKDLSGVDVCQAQQTPVSMRQDDVYLYFSCDVELQIPIENMPKGSAVFFEFYHYKQQKRMKSIKCFSFMEMDEFKSGPCIQEAYRLQEKEAFSANIKAIIPALITNITQMI